MSLIDNFKLEFITNDKNSPVQFIIHDAFGRKIFNKSFTPIEINNMEFGDNFPNGIYFVSLEQGNLNIRKKVIKHTN